GPIPGALAWHLSPGVVPSTSSQTLPPPGETGKNCKTKHKSSRAGKLLPAVSLRMAFPVFPLWFLACCLPLCLPFLTSFYL
uniref:Uncharacterized protein n=1 Tax=Athene cunicularia TaxID=194338 RepID=A0A663N715_ATHCN